MSPRSDLLAAARAAARDYDKDEARNTAFRFAHAWERDNGRGSIALERALVAMMQALRTAATGTRGLLARALYETAKVLDLTDRAERLGVADAPQSKPPYYADPER